MKSRLTVALALLGAFVAVPLTGEAQTKQLQDQQEKILAALKKYGTPGKEHKRLNPMVGNWNVVAKFYMAPGAPALESKGTAKQRWILGKRYLRLEYKGTAFGQPFSGMGITGFDRMKKKYVSTWTDSMSTAIMSSEGTYDKKSKTFVHMGTSKDIFDGKSYETRDTTRIISKDEHVMVMSRRPAGAKDAKFVTVLELRYTRAAKKKKKK